ncbi:hypothetical protein GQ457_06G013430 [Hibiscus cannabinus]
MCSDQGLEEIVEEPRLEQTKRRGKGIVIRDQMDVVDIFTSFISCTYVLWVLWALSYVTGFSEFDSLIASLLLIEITSYHVSGDFSSCFGWWYSLHPNYGM